MPSRFYLFYFGAEAAVVTETPAAPARWTEVSGTAKSWQAGPRAGILPRFNRIYQQEPGTPQFERTTDAVN